MLATPSACRVARATLVALTTIAIACGSPTSADYPIHPPSSKPPTPTSPTPGPVGAFPTPARPAQVYMGDPGIYAIFAQSHGGTLQSRFVWYEDSTFALQFSSGQHGHFEYAGRYSVSGTQVTMTWEGWSLAGPWGATAQLRGDTLAVSYNVVMSLSDFIDGVYVRVR